MLSWWGRVRAKATQTHRRITERKCDCECMAILSVSRSEWFCMQTVNERFRKWNNIHVGEVSYWINDRSCKTVSCMRQLWDSDKKWNSANTSWYECKWQKAFKEIKKTMLTQAITQKATEMLQKTSWDHLPVNSWAGYVEKSWMWCGVSEI